MAGKKLDQIWILFIDNAFYDGWKQNTCFWAVAQLYNGVGFEPSQF
jgi:hypothetical protein